MCLEQALALWCMPMARQQRAVERPMSEAPAAQVELTASDRSRWPRYLATCDRAGVRCALCQLAIKMD